MNAISPGAIADKRINRTSRMPFKQMENVSAFLKAARQFGVPEADLVRVKKG